MDKYMCKSIYRIKYKNNARSSTYNKKSLERRYDAYKYGPVVSVDNSWNVVIINKMTIV